MSITPPPEGHIVNRNRMLKKGAKATGAAASVGISIAQNITGSGALALLAGATSATGFGLVITGGALTVGSSLTSARSAYKTKNHINSLEIIHATRTEHSCEKVGSGQACTNEHHMIANKILPYIINQKGKKYSRKLKGSVPGISLLEGIRAITKKGYKKYKGTLGKDRELAADWLSRHLLTHNCHLVELIVAELYSFEEMHWIKEQEHDLVVPLLIEKLKST